MESKAGSILALISGVLYFISVAFAIMFAVLAFVGGEDMTSDKGVVVSSSVAGILGLMVAIVLLIFALILIKGYKQMKTAETCKSGAIKALVAGIIGLNILAIIGGAIGLSDSKK